MNVSTIIVLAVVCIISGAIIAKGIINKKNGKSSCSCGCGGCAMADVCHKKQNK